MLRQPVTTRHTATVLSARAADRARDAGLPAAPIPAAALTTAPSTGYATRVAG
jgi:hypothetical protein